MKSSGPKKPGREPLAISCDIAEQCKEMGSAIGEIRREKSRLSIYLERIKAQKSWWWRWFSVG